MNRQFQSRMRMRQDMAMAMLMGSCAQNQVHIDIPLFMSKRTFGSSGGTRSRSHRGHRSGG